MSKALCRFCKSELKHDLVDLGMHPLSNAFIKPDQLSAMEPYYPLHAYVCEKCLLVQLMEFESPQQIFSDYVYFSSYSESWLAHAKAYAEQMISTLDLGTDSQVVEIASNDGYLLKNFVERDIPTLGIEPAENVAAVAIKKGVPTRSLFFGQQTARELLNEGYSSDLMAANNVLAHVPDINDFVVGFKILLKPDGVATVEFPHLYNLLRLNQFDTIYHEHFSYLSLYSVEQILDAHDMRVFQVDQLSTHGGSLRLYFCHKDSSKHPQQASVDACRKLEQDAGMHQIEGYQDFQQRVYQVKSDLLDFLINARREGKTIAAYGAAAKGNTLLNYCGIGTDFIDFVVDKNPHKQNTYLPGSHIPVVDDAMISRKKPDYLIILPWNIEQEIVNQTDYISDWGGRHVVAIPELRVL